MNNNYEKLDLFSGKDLKLLNKIVMLDINFEYGNEMKTINPMISTPGHMPGHISLYLKETNSIITGDASVIIENNKLVIANPQFALDLELAKKSLEKLISMNADNYYCYHGEKFVNLNKH